MAANIDESEPLAPGMSNGKMGLLLLTAWLIPGSGHLAQKRWVRGLVFFGLVCFSIIIGSVLDGKLFQMQSGSPLATLGTLASLGAGLPYMILRWVMDYQGDIRSASYEYGGAFLLTSGLMNVLAVLDAWDVARGRKP